MGEMEIGGDDLPDCYRILTYGGRGWLLPITYYLLYYYLLLVLYWGVLFLLHRQSDPSETDQLTLKLAGEEEKAFPGAWLGLVQHSSSDQWPVTVTVTVPVTVTGMGMGILTRWLADWSKGRGRSKGWDAPLPPYCRNKFTFKVSRLLDTPVAPPPKNTTKFAFLFKTLFLWRVMSCSRGGGNMGCAATSVSLASIVLYVCNVFGNRWIRWIKVHQKVYSIYSSQKHRVIIIQV